MTYTPDKWIVVKIGGNKPHYKIFGSWYGSYLGSDSWKMNSGIKSYKKDKTKYIFYGYSGSEYICHKDQEGLSGYGADVFANIKKKFEPGIVSIISMQEYMKVCKALPTTATPS